MHAPVVASIAVLNWPFGPVEALSIVVFLGYCITFCIHIAHAYCMVASETKDVKERACNALLHLGAAVMTAATS